MPRGRGRPPTGNVTEVRLPPELREAIEAWGRARWPESKQVVSPAIRELIELGLGAQPDPTSCPTCGRPFHED